MNLNNMDSEDNQNWYEVRVLGKNPERRGYHSSFICNKKLYIYGGHDIREGSLNSLWMLNLGHLSDLDKPENEQDKKLMWHHTDTSGPSPGAISHHTSVVFNERMYLFGGSKANGEENSKFFSLDLKSYRWEVIQSRGQVPTTRDEHTALIYEGSLIIFGGFVNGVRSNEIYRYYFNDNRWELVQQLSDECPPARAGHSAIQYGDKTPQIDYDIRIRVRTIIFLKKLIIVGVQLKTILLMIITIGLINCLYKIIQSGCVNFAQEQLCLISANNFQFDCSQLQSLILD